MLQFPYKLKITERVKGKCERHPRYNPEKDGRAGIRSACSCCFSLFDLHQARIALDAAQREFIRRAAPWVRQRNSRRRRLANATGNEGSSSRERDGESPWDQMPRPSSENALMSAIRVVTAT
jgi:hypothetical protein